MTSGQSTKKKFLLPSQQKLLKMSPEEKEKEHLLIS